MRINPINNVNSFKSVWYSDNLNVEQKKLASHIENTMKKPCKIRRKDTIPNDWLEKKGYDLYIKAGKNPNSVKTYLIDKVQEFDHSNVYIKDLVCEVDSADKFSVSQVRNVRRDQVYLKLLIFAFPILFAFGNALNFVQAKKGDVSCERNIKEILVDSTKNLKNDTLKSRRIVNIKYAIRNLKK